jgi:hypothetical protein
LPAVAASLGSTSSLQHGQPRVEDQATLDALFARYTMERERDVHHELLRRIGLASMTAVRRVEVPAAADDGIELF